MAGAAHIIDLGTFPERTEHPICLAEGVSAEEFLALPEDGRRLELFDGEIWMAASPRGRHQRLAHLLGRILDAEVEKRHLGLLYSSPVDIKIGPRRVVAPDMCLLARDHPQVGTDWTYLMHPPLLVVEIVSPSTRRRDWGTKVQYFQEFGVPNYWVVELAESQIYAHTLVNGRYREVTRPDPSVLEAPPFMGLSIDLAALFGEE